MGRRHVGRVDESLSTTWWRHTYLHKIVIVSLTTKSCEFCYFKLYETREIMLLQVVYLDNVPNGKVHLPTTNEYLLTPARKTISISSIVSVGCRCQCQLLRLANCPDFRPLCPASQPQYWRDANCPDFWYSKYIFFVLSAQLCYCCF